MAKPTTERRIANRYVLQALLGRGGMGVVWRAQDTLLAREVAIKELQLPPSLSSAEVASMRARVLREARAAARLNHPGAVTLYDVVQEEGNTFIVMELVDASTLAHLVRERGPLPPDQVAAIGLQVLDALRAAHRVGIVHRDVKPGNVMVASWDGRAKLADFGIASLAGDPQLTSTGVVLGSPAYMAPEQANGKPSGPPTDLWALGATMYYAVEGEPPFDKSGPVPTLTAVVNDPPRPMRRAGALAPVILALLAKSPAERPSASQLQLQLERVVAAGAEVTASHPMVAAPVDPAPAEEEHEPTARLPAVASIPPPPPAGQGPAPLEQAPSAPVEQAPAGVEQAPPPPPAGQGPAPLEQAPPAAEQTPGGPVEQAPAGVEPAPPGVEQAPAGGEVGPAAAAAPAPVPAVLRDMRPAPAGPATKRPAPPLPDLTPGRSRRGPLLAAALLAVVGVLAVVLLPRALSDRGGREGAVPSVTSAGGATAAPTTRVPGNTGAAATTTGVPATTAAGQNVPAGWQVSSHPDRGFALAVPGDWRVSQSSRQVTFRAPGPDWSFFVQSKTPPNDLQDAAAAWERHIQSKHGNDGLRLLSKGFDTYQGRRAYILEYTYRDRSRLVHERDVNLAIGRWGYALVFTAPDADWAEVDRTVWSGVEQSFSPLG